MYMYVYMYIVLYSIYSVMYICIVIYIFQDCEELGILHPKPSNLAASRPQVLRSPLNVKPVRLEGRLGRNWGDGHVHMSIHVHSCSYKWGFPNDGGMTIIHMLLIQVCGIIAGARWNTRKVCCFWQTKNCNGTMVINCNTHRERLVGFGWSDSTMFTWSYGYGSIPIHTIFSGMNIHLLAILMFTRGTRFWHTAISSKDHPRISTIAQHSSQNHPAVIQQSCQFSPQNHPNKNIQHNPP